MDNGIKESINLNGKHYLAVEDVSYDCYGCAFENSAVECGQSNEILTCSNSDRDIIWKEYKPNQFSMKEEYSSVSTQVSDSIVAEIRELLLQRSQTGITKYGTTLDRKDLKPSEWCQHLLEELLDASGYVLRLKKDLEVIEALTQGKK